jgi:hypothetical protein
MFFKGGASAEFAPKKTPKMAEAGRDCDVFQGGKMRHAKSRFFCRAFDFAHGAPPPVGEHTILPNTGQTHCGDCKKERGAETPGGPNAENKSMENQA